MTVEPMTISLKPDAKPYACFTPIPAPFHLKKVKNKWDSETRVKVARRCSEGAGMLTVMKLKGDPKRVVDFQELNKATSHEIHHTPSPINLVASIPRGKLKT